ncbi:MAG: thioredoxin fold domain-containing protein [Cocleimonas sp.]
MSTLIFLLSMSSHASKNIESALIEENDFRALSKTMKEENLGLVLMLHAEHCPYCILMENEILSPMIKSGEYDKKIVIRKLQIDEARDVIDFSGKTVEPSDISGRYKAFLTPTLVFLDHKGNERVEQMVGINTVEMFGAYLDIEIDKLTKELVGKSADNNTAQLD